MHGGLGTRRFGDPGSGFSHGQVVRFLAFPPCLFFSEVGHSQMRWSVFPTEVSLLNEVERGVRGIRTPLDTGGCRRMPCCGVNPAPAVPKIWPIRLWPTEFGQPFLATEFGCRVKPRQPHQTGPPGSHTTPGELQTCTFEGPVLPREDPQRGQKRTNFAAGKKARNFGPPTLRPPPHFSNSRPSNPHPRQLKTHKKNLNN